MANERITSEDVAKLASVSQSAVSRVFTPGASYSERTARRVRKAARELGYRPNVIARSLITGRSHMIGLVVAYLENYFYPDALEKLSNALQRKGYHVLFFLARQTAGDIEDVLQEILDYQVDGIIMASVAMSSELATRCQAAGIPVVLFNRSQDDPQLSAVTSDNFEGGREVARLLAAGKHRRIGYIAGWEGASTQRDREFGFRTGLREAGIELAAREVGDFDFQRAQEAARRMFRPEDRPDAVFVANDHMAFAAMDVLRFELGLQVPGQVSVVGYDDVPPASWPAYDLTTVRQNADKMVAETVNLLIASIEQHGATTRSIRVPSPLVARGSAQIPEGWGQ